MRGLTVLFLITIAVAIPHDKCKPGTNWMEECNFCSCTENGVAICTIMACMPAPGQLCTPGSTWQEDCNTCFCTEDGQPACTEMACLPPEESKCEPGTTFTDDCNFCFCDSSGRPVCTKMACPSSEELKIEKPGKCPASSGQIGICIFDPEINCLFDSECSEDRKCCPEGCNKICKEPLP